MVMNLCLRAWHRCESTTVHIPDWPVIVYTAWMHLNVIAADLTLVLQPRRQVSAFDLNPVRPAACQVERRARHLGHQITIV